MTDATEKMIQTPVNLNTLRGLKQHGEKFACLTAYDASFAHVFETAGVEVLLVGDSLGMVIQGERSTLPVTLDDMVYHTRCVSRGAPNSFIIADMPFMSDASPQQALQSAARLMKEGGAHMVKMEGGAVMEATVQALSERGIPVCAHLGLLPQSVNKLGGYKVQGRDSRSAQDIQFDAMRLVKAGADMVLLECVPAVLAAEITQELSVPVIGIGAGSACDAQVLVSYDMLGLGQGKSPRFVKNFMVDNDSILGAVEDYVACVKTSRFPAEEHSYC